MPSVIPDKIPISLGYCQLQTRKLVLFQWEVDLYIIIIIKDSKQYSQKFNDPPCIVKIIYVEMWGNSITIDY